jgi:glucokinase
VQVAIGIDLGGTKIAGGVIGTDGTVLARVVIPTETTNETTLISGVTKVALELRAAAPGAKRIGIGAAGLIDPYAGVIVTSPNLPTRNLGLASIIEARTGCDVLLENDANVAALAEARVGAGVGARSVVMLTIGTGLGGGIVIDGALVRGARGFAGEIGHIVIDRDGPECTCGARGCLEAFVNGRTLASQPIEEVAGALGLGLVTLSNLLDPERFVIGGGAGTGLFEQLIGPARDVLAAGVLGAGKRPIPDIVVAELGADAGMIGAGSIVLPG